ncbi:MAG: serine/threonine-protein kinase [Polyangiales bacterium]
MLERFRIDNYYIDERVDARAEAYLYRGSHLSGHAVLVALSRTQGENNTLRRAARFEHEQVARLVGAGHDDALDRDFAVYERPEGESVRTYVSEHGPLSFRVAVQTLIEATNVLASARATGLGHGGFGAWDVWVMPPSFSRACVTGFGLGPQEGSWAHLRDSPPEPEDVRALGELAYEMLTKSRWAPGQSTRISTHSNTTVVPSAFEDLLAGCLHEVPTERPSLSRVARSLVALLGDEETCVGLDPLIGAMVGSYRVEDLLGEGGMGAVYRGTHPRIGTTVAIKVIHSDIANSPTTVQRFEREARASSSIGSPNIPSFYDFGLLPDGRPYAVMEFFEGESLGERIERAGPVPTSVASRILMQAAGALAEAHAKEIIHRDVKPDNLFLTSDSTGDDSVRLLDFGIAKVSTTKDGAQLTRAGSFLGTPVYCAPEQMYGLEPSPVMDVYALGATAYEMLSGELPHAGDVQSILQQKAAATPPRAEPLANLPSRVRATVLRAMAHNPDKRFRTMEEFAHSVSLWETEGEPAPAWDQKKVLTLFVAMLVVGVLGVGAWMWLMSTEDTESITAEPPMQVQEEPVEQAEAETVPGSEVDEAEAEAAAQAEREAEAAQAEAAAQAEREEAAEAERSAEAARLRQQAREARAERATMMRRDPEPASMQTAAPIVADPFAN